MPARPRIALGDDGDPLLQKRIISRVLMRKEKLTLPWPFRLFRMFPMLRRVPARIIGVGFRPEHVLTARMTPGKPVFNRTIGLRDTFAKEVGGKG